MKARSVLSGKRLATGIVAAVSAAVLLSGCGFPTRQEAAAIVNGEIISENDVHTTTEQLNKAQLQATEDVIVNLLISRRLLDAELDKPGGWKPDATYAQTIATIPGATETTKEVVEVAALFQSPEFAQSGVESLKQAVSTAKVTVNPKYGTFRRTEQAPYFTLTGGQPNWIVPTTPAPTPTAQ